MVFSSVVFLFAFLPAVLLLYCIAPGMKAKNFILIIASLIFYAYGEPVYIVLMLVSSCANWLFGVLLGKVPQKNIGTQKLIVAIAVVLNLAFLAVFKYADWGITSLNQIFALNIALTGITLPIGISFYTFQAMSYVIDVYRGQVAAQRSFFKVLLYIAFFPQLIAGPIVRYHDIELQLANRKMTLVGCAYGFRRFCVGLGKKVLIANSMAVVVDAIFAAPQNEVNIAVAWVAAIAYILQIYFDFSGYSDMAIGLARIFGFEYKENFNYPYVSTSVKEFWRRWHISLSTWFKEYLYIPLGGNRKGRLRTCLNKIIVFFCCGLWHGAAWTFVIWGLIHGAFLLLEEYLPIKKLPKALGWIYTMLVITFAFVIFRADTWPQAVFMMGQMLTGFSFNAPSMQLLMQQLTPVFLVSIVCAIIAATPIKTKLNALAQSAGKLQIWDAVTFVLCILLFAISVLSLASGAYNPFIYFRF